MASSSASASTSQFPRWNYDVFLSFRGEDTRKSFTSHLYELLDIRGIKTFQDDKRLEHGASISDELCKAIEDSQCAVIIFSKNYATSRWCLNELVKIMDCKTQFGQTVIPVFYDVDPSHVRNQRESFAEAFSKHETKFKDDVEVMQRWRIALTAAANLKGCDIGDNCHFGAEYGLDVLIEKSLVFITEDGEIKMHDLIQEMGRYIVNLQKNPGERNRLWHAKDFEEVMTNNAGTMTVEAIWVDSDFRLQFSNEAMKNMKRLRILYTKWWSYDDSDFSHDGSIEYLSNNLRWFVLDDYLCESLPSTFEPKMLVHLQLRRSSLHYLWMETKHLPFLRKIDLSGSKRLMQTPDFTGMPNLEYLYLFDCSNLEEVHYSLRFCSKLIELELGYCKSLKRFPCVNVESLKYVSVEYCYSLEKFPEIHGRMKPEIHINMRPSGPRELPSSYFQCQTHITKLDLRMENLVALPSSICRLKSLVSLDVSCCSKLQSLPEEIGDLDNLEELDASYSLISRLPSTIVRLNKLKIMKFRGLQDGVHFEFPHVAEGLRSLEHLNLSYCNLTDGGLPEDIGSLSSLKYFDLTGNNFKHLPRSIAQLGAL